jgi:hypothetical protein
MFLNLSTQCDWFDYLNLCTPPKHPRTHLACPANPHDQFAFTIRQIDHMLAMVPDAFFDS